MIKWLKNHFIPHEGNAYQPHFLRLKRAAGILALLLLIEAFYLTQSFVVLPLSESFAAIFSSVLIEQTNEKRLAERLAALSPNPKLTEAARMKAEDMALKGYFAHNAPDGTTPWHWVKLAGYDYAAAGENLAVNFTDSKDVTEAWMHSPLHRANIVNGNYTEIGIATAQGIYKGREAIFVVQMFGRQSPIVPPAVPALEKIVTKTPAVQPSVLPSSPKSLPTKQVLVVPPAPPQVATTVAPFTGTSTPASTTERVAGAETIAPPVPPVEMLQPVATPPNSLFSLLASPRQIATTAYLILAALLTFALGLAVFVKVRIQHPHIIANGALLLAITFSLVMFNAALGAAQGVI